MSVDEDFFNLKTNSKYEVDVLLFEIMRVKICNSYIVVVLA